METGVAFSLFLSVQKLSVPIESELTRSPVLVGRGTLCAVDR